MGDAKGGKWLASQENKEWERSVLKPCFSNVDATFMFF